MKRDENQNVEYKESWCDKGAGIMDSIDDKEYSGAVLSLFEYGKNFVKRGADPMDAREQCN